MSEMIKTTIYVVVAALVGVLAAVNRPTIVTDNPHDQIGKPLFADFTDPLDAARLEIVKYDAEMGQLQEFGVALVDGIWSITSHNNYPADAKDQMQEVATSLVDLNVVGIASDVAGDHEVYGVVEPDKKSTSVGDKGVGTLVSIQDEKSKQLAHLIIGKKVKDRDDQRFVRVPDKNRVYAVKLDAEKFTTVFDDWIEQDLLQLNPLDVDSVTLNDYSVQATPTITGQIAVQSQQRLAMTVSTTDGGKWQLDSLQEAHQDKLEPTHLLDSEELNSERLDDLKTALDELKIVDVQRKPDGLGRNLKADAGFMEDREGVQSLINRGFYPISAGADQYDLLSSEGEVMVGLKNGVEYVLRFGEVASLQEGETGKLNRFLFVTARLDEGKIPKPVLEPLPAGAEQISAEEAKSGDDAGDDESETEDDEFEEEDPEVTRIKTENQRKQDEYNEKLKTANEQVYELNHRFGDWYYVISEDEYKKIHLGRADIIKEKDSAKEEGFGVDAFRSLEEQGIEPDEEPAPSAGSPAPGAFPGAFPG